MEDERSNDMCPVCKTDRYLSPNMRFLINPECYHKICESCVDRIFSLGPAKCPYPKCYKTLRKNKFKNQLFEDINIEREVDLRKRIQAVYNKTEEDFDTLQDYNSYLETIEEMIYNLTNGINTEEIEKEVTQYQNDHMIEILERATRESQKNEDWTKHQEALETLRQAKLKLIKEQEEEEVAEQKQQRLKLVEKLQNSDVDPEELMRQHRAETSQRTSQRERDIIKLSKELEDLILPIARAAGGAEAGPLTPFTPFCGDRNEYSSYTLLGKPVADIVDISDTYYDPFVSKLAQDREYLGSGWRLKTVFERALDEAFMGLHCYIDTEKSEQTQRIEIDAEPAADALLVIPAP